MNGNLTQPQKMDIQSEIILTQFKYQIRWHSFNSGAWLSPVERVVWDHEIGGSNPLAPKSVKSDFL